MHFARWCLLWRNCCNLSQHDWLPAATPATVAPVRLLPILSADAQFITGWHVLKPEDMIIQSSDGPWATLRLYSPPSSAALMRSSVRPRR